MFVNDSLYNQYASLLQALNSLQTEYDILVQQDSPLPLVQSIKTQIEITRGRLEKVTDQLVYINPFSGERELPVGHELMTMMPD